MKRRGKLGEGMNGGKLYDSINDHKIFYSFRGGVKFFFFIYNGTHYKHFAIGFPELKDGNTFLRELNAEVIHVTVNLHDI